MFPWMCLLVSVLLHFILSDSLSAAPYGLAQLGVLCANNTLCMDREDGEECSGISIPYNQLKGLCLVFSLMAQQNNTAVGRESIGRTLRSAAMDTGVCLCLSVKILMNFSELINVLFCSVWYVFFPELRNEAVWETVNFSFSCEDTDKTQTGVARKNSF